jgi:hypothetical protein
LQASDDERTTDPSRTTKKKDTDNDEVILGVKKDCGFWQEEEVSVSGTKAFESEMIEMCEVTRSFGVD